jgi:hypothetical protein
MSEKKISLAYAFFWIVNSCLFVITSFFLIQTLYHNHKLKKIKDSSYNINAIIQTGPQKEALHSIYLSELLNFSIDKPTNIYLFDEKKAEKKLLNSPLIKKANIKKIFPAGIYIDYTIRQPIAWFGDFENIALDTDGYIFPVYPFLTPKKLPEVYLDIASFDEIGWNKPITGRNIDLALTILKFLSTDEFQKAFHVKKIDVSKAFSDSFGKKEVIITIEEEMNIKKSDKEILCVFPRILRLSLKNYEKQLSNYLSLREKMLCDYKKQLSNLEDDSDTIKFLPKVIDLRISDLAFIDR